MTSLINRFLTLDKEERRTVHFALCEFALQNWSIYAKQQKIIQYRESVVGTYQTLDFQLPQDAFETAKHNLNPRNVKRRYLEPITAMQDDDLSFPGHMEFAYYSIYNLYRKYALEEPVDDWIIVNQALSSEVDPEKWEVLLENTIKNVKTE